MGRGDSGFDQKMDVNEAERLKYLGFVHSAALRATLCFSNLYVSSKDKSGPLKPGVESVEGAVKTVVGPVYHKYRDVPIELLRFVDLKMDKTMTDLDHRIPPHVKQRSKQAFSATQKAPEVARSVVSEVRRDGVMGIAKNVYSKYEPVAEQYATSVWQSLNRLPLFPKVAEVVVPTAAYCSEKYNRTVRLTAENGYRVANYLPLIPTVKIAKVFAAGKHEAETEIQES